MEVTGARLQTPPVFTTSLHAILILCFALRTSHSLCLLCFVPPADAFWCISVTPRTRLFVSGLSVKPDGVASDAVLLAKVVQRSVNEKSKKGTSTFKRRSAASLAISLARFAERAAFVSRRERARSVVENPRSRKKI